MKPLHPQPPSENPFANLVVNILLPVVILNKGGKYLDPRWTLLLALALPLGYGMYDYVAKGRKNYVSLVGILNILLTGSLALLSLQGIWFAVKEAMLPFVLGVLVLGSAWTGNPAAKMMFCNPQILNMELIYERLATMLKEGDFDRLLRRTTLWLSVSFFISSVLNFVLAYSIFVDIDPSLASLVREQTLNDQIARMTWMGYVVIALPLMVFSGALIYFFLRRVAGLTELPINALLKDS